MVFEKILGLGTAIAEETVAATGDAAAEAAAEANPIVSLLFTMMIRPQRKKDKQVKEMLNNLKAGDRICTIGGIYGTITGIQDDTVKLAVGRENTSMVVARWAIRSVEEVQIENDAQELN